MTGPDALAQLRRVCSGTAGDGVHLAARLLDAVEQARDLLAPLADEESAAGAVALAAFQLLADAAADAAPPSIAPDRTLPAPASRKGPARLLADALARGRGQELDGSPRRECRPLKP